MTQDRFFDVGSIEWDSLHINESPDESNGKNGPLYFEDEDCVPFGFIGTVPIIGDGENNYRHDIIWENIEAACQYASSVEGVKEYLKISGLKTGTITQDFIDRVMEISGNKKQRRGDSLGRAAISPSGRYWERGNVISFWSRKRDVTKAHIDALAKASGAHIKDMKFEFLDDSRAGFDGTPYKDMATYDDLFVSTKSKKPTIDPESKMTDKEIADILRMAHTAPSKLSAKERDIVKSLRGKPSKSPKSIPLDMRLKMTLGDSMDNETLFESPDTVGPLDHSSTVFGTVDGIYFWKHGVSHPSIAMVIAEAAREFHDENFTVDDVNQFLYDANIMLEKPLTKKNIQNFYKILSKVGMEDGRGFYDKHLKSVREIFSPSGRAWDNLGVISYWNKKDSISKNDVDKVLSLPPLKTSEREKDDWKIQFIDDKPQRKDDIKTYGEIFKPGKSLDSSERLSDKEVAAILRKAHTQPGKLSDEEQQVVNTFRGKGKGARHSKRIPLDVRLKNTIGDSVFDSGEIDTCNESPDQIIGPSGDYIFHDSKGSYGFGFYEGIAIAIKESIHPAIIYGLTMAASDSVTPSMLRKVLKADNIIVGKDFTQSQIDEIIKNKTTLRHIDLETIRRTLSPAGRIWTKEKIISFWARRKDVSKKHIDDILSLVGDSASRDKYVFEFIDDNRDTNPKYDELTPYSDLFSTSPKVDDRIKLSDKEIAEILKKRHTAPSQLTADEKDVIKSVMGSSDWKKKSKRAIPLDLRLKSTIGDSFEEIIFETPDKTISPDGDELTWEWPRNRVAFGFIDGICFGKEKVTHRELLDDLFDCTKESDNAREFIGKASDKGIIMSDMVNDTQYEKLKIEIVDLFYLSDNNVSILRKYMSPSGRSWTNEKVISFWNKRSEVKQDHIRKIGICIRDDIKNYHFEFVDSKRPSEESIKYADLFGGKKSHAIDPKSKMTDKEVADILRKAHTTSNLTDQERDVVNRFRGAPKRPKRRVDLATRLKTTIGDSQQKRGDIIKNEVNEDIESPGSDEDALSSMDD